MPLNFLKWSSITTISPDLVQPCKAYSPSFHFLYFPDIFILQLEAIKLGHIFISVLIILLQMLFKLLFSYLNSRAFSRAEMNL